MIHSVPPVTPGAAPARQPRGHRRTDDLRSPAFDQVGVLPYRLRNGQVEVLLITSRRQGRWIIPKGNLAPRRTPQELALEEAYEEAGVRGTLAPVVLGHYVHGDAPGQRVRVFLMQVEQVLASWPEQPVRRRVWLPYREAQARVDEKGLRRLLGVFGAPASERSFRQSAPRKAAKPGGGFPTLSPSGSEGAVADPVKKGV